MEKEGGPSDKLATDHERKGRVMGKRREARREGAAKEEQGNGRLRVECEMSRRRTDGMHLFINGNGNTPQALSFIVPVPHLRTFDYVQNKRSCLQMGHSIPLNSEESVAAQYYSQ